MLMGIISDTHLSDLSEDFKKVVRYRFSDCDLVVHAGDFTSPAVYHYLKKITFGNFLAVCGNMDPPELRKELSEKLIFKQLGIKFGLIHGWGGSQDLEHRIEGRFINDSVQCIIYGHSHKSANRMRGEVLFFNPGSLRHNYQGESGSIGYISIQGSNITGEIIKISYF